MSLKHILVIFAKNVCFLRHTHFTIFVSGCTRSLVFFYLGRFFWSTYEPRGLLLFKLYQRTLTLALLPQLPNFFDLFSDCYKSLFFFRPIVFCWFKFDKGKCFCYICDIKILFVTCKPILESLATP